jgi:dTDP-4-dehydrorhamnose 3,5-epimerase
MSDRPILIETPLKEDNRGYFRKIYSKKDIEKLGILKRVEEIFSTSSTKYVIRGMHFQDSPHATGKLIWVTNGAICDFVVDVRSTPSFGEIHEFKLSYDSGDSLWIPPGFAHGFQSMSDNSIVNYATDGAYDASSDKGVLWNSCGINWPRKPTNISKRDSEFCTLAEYRILIG